MGVVRTWLSLTFHDKAPDHLTEAVTTRMQKFKNFALRFGIRFLFHALLVVIPLSVTFLCQKPPLLTSSWSFSILTGILFILIFIPSFFSIPSLFLKISRIYFFLLSNSFPKSNPSLSTSSYLPPPSSPSLSSLPSSLPSSSLPSSSLPSSSSTFLGSQSSTIEKESKESYSLSRECIENREFQVMILIGFLYCSILFWIVRWMHLFAISLKSENDFGGRKDTHFVAYWTTMIALSHQIICILFYNSIHWISDVPKYYPMLQSSESLSGPYQYKAKSSTYQSPTASLRSIHDSPTLSFNQKNERRLDLNLLNEQHLNHDQNFYHNLMDETGMKENNSEMISISNFSMKDLLQSKKDPSYLFDKLSSPKHFFAFCYDNFLDILTETISLALLSNFMGYTMRDGIHESSIFSIFTFFLLNTRNQYNVEAFGSYLILISHMFFHINLLRYTQQNKQKHIRSNLPTLLDIRYGLSMAFNTASQTSDKKLKNYMHTFSYMIKSALIYTKALLVTGIPFIVYISVAYFIFNACSFTYVTIGLIYYITVPMIIAFAKLLISYLREYTLFSIGLLFCMELIPLILLIQIVK